jgi:hypothetical protein
MKDEVTYQPTEPRGQRSAALLPGSSRSRRQDRILIIQEHLPHYRVPFFEQLKSLLDERGIRLDLAYSAGGTSKLLPGFSHAGPPAG